MLNGRTKASHRLLLAATGLLLAAATVLAAEDADILSRYRQAEQFLRVNKGNLVLNGDVQHHWINSQDRFWYRREHRDGMSTFVVVDAEGGSTVPAFDHERLAEALAEASGEMVVAARLPFTHISFDARMQEVRFRAFGGVWVCDIQGRGCNAGDAPAMEGVVSPDGKWRVFEKNYNVFLAPVHGGAAKALTTDGVRHHAYGGYSEGDTRFISRKRAGIKLHAAVLWSPDSRKVLTHRLDERKVESLHLVQSVPENGSFRPKLYSYRYAMPGDQHLPKFHPVIFDVETGKRIDVAVEQVRAFLNVFPFQSLGHAWWTEDSDSLYLVSYSRFNKSVELYRVDPETGFATTVIRETSDTDGIVRLAHENDEPLIVRVLQNGDVVWFSERDGYGHLYLYDGKTGLLKNRITHGEWVVRDIALMDEAGGYVYFLASGVEAGANPYLRQLYRVRLDGSGMRLLTPEKADHLIRVTPVDYTRASIRASGGVAPGEGERGFSPSGRFFVDVVSGVTQPSRTIVRKANGELMSVVVEEDVSELKRLGHTAVEPFVVTAADGRTPLYGNLYRPSDFDPGSRYPLIDAIYGGPQFAITAQRFDDAIFGFGNPAQTLAELGFIVITVDGRGTPFRSRAFLEESYGALGDAGNLDDHIAAIRELSTRFPYIDIDKVGIFGHSAGGYAATHAILKYPDIFKVAFASAGNHDQRGNTYVWAETYNGPQKGNNYLAASNIPLAKNLKGKLFLVHGEMDDNVHPALTMRLVDALVRANKDFEFLIVPSQNHSSSGAYMTRKRWDYFVEHLRGETPPDYRIESLSRIE